MAQERRREAERRKTEVLKSCGAGGMKHTAQATRADTSRRDPNRCCLVALVYGSCHFASFDAMLATFTQIAEMRSDDAPDGA